MIKNVVITSGQLLSVLCRDDGAPDQHQPKHKKKERKKFPSRFLWVVFKYSAYPESHSQDELTVLRSCL